MEEPATAVLVTRNRTSPLQKTEGHLSKEQRDDHDVKIAQVVSRKRTAASAHLASEQVQ